MRRCRVTSRRTWPSGLPAIPDAIDLGGQRREIATLFTDIASFTALVETLEPDVLGPLLNDYLAGMTDVVFAHDGTVAKIVGDAMHVLFGAPGEQPDHAARAVACALALDEYAQSFPRALAAKRDCARGHADRRACRAGDRRQFRRRPLSSTTPPMATPSTSRRGWKPPTNNSAPAFASARLSRRKSEFRGRPVGDLLLRGKTEALRAFEPLRPTEYDDPATRSYLDGFAKLEANDPGAIAALPPMSARTPATSSRAFT